MDIAQVEPWVLADVTHDRPIQPEHAAVLLTELDRLREIVAGQRVELDTARGKVAQLRTLVRAYAESNADSPEGPCPCADCVEDKLRGGRDANEEN